LCTKSTALNPGLFILIWVFKRVPGIQSNTNSTQIKTNINKPVQNDRGLFIPNYEILNTTGKL
jgi:hypothetical protein